MLAIGLAEFLETAGIGAACRCSSGLIVVIALLDFIMPGRYRSGQSSRRSSFPLFVRLGVAPQTVLAAYRVGDSPVDTLHPLIICMPFIVTIAQRYQKDAGIGTVVALMIPFVIAILVAWILLFVIWFWLGIPLGPGYPITT